MAESASEAFDELYAHTENSPGQMVSVGRRTFVETFGNEFQGKRLTRACIRLESRIADEGDLIVRNSMSWRGMDSSMCGAAVAYRLTNSDAHFLDGFDEVIEMQCELGRFIKKTKDQADYQEYLMLWEKLGMLCQFLKAAAPRPDVSVTNLFPGRLEIGPDQDVTQHPNWPGFCDTLSTAQARLRPNLILFDQHCNYVDPRLSTNQLVSAARFICGRSLS